MRNILHVLYFYFFSFKRIIEYKMMGILMVASKINVGIIKGKENTNNNMSENFIHIIRYP